MNEFLIEKINEAHALLDERMYQECVRRLQNLKYRVHETEPRNKIIQFEQTHDSELKKRLDTIKNTSADPLLEERDTVVQWEKYAQSYLDFYDGLTKQYDI